MMAIAALVAWVLTASIGGYMLRTWVARGGLRRQRATGVGVPPAVVFGHASAALVGLAAWTGFLKTNWDPLAWLGVALITTAIALGVCTVTLWTPYPVVVPSAAVPPTAPPAAPLTDTLKITDEMIASMLDDPFPARHRPRPKLGPLIPVVHGFGALTTFMLAVFAAIGGRLACY
jgi:manganese efflux pump family protein